MATTNSSKEKPKKLGYTVVGFDYANKRFEEYFYREQAKSEQDAIEQAEKKHPKCVIEGAFPGRNQVQPAPFFAVASSPYIPAAVMTGLAHKADVASKHAQGTSTNGAEVARVVRSVAIEVEEIIAEQEIKAEIEEIEEEEHRARMDELPKCSEPSDELPRESVAAVKKKEPSFFMKVLRNGT